MLIMSRVCRVWCLPVQVLSCLVFVCLGSVIAPLETNLDFPRSQYQVILSRMKNGGDDIESKGLELSGKHSSKCKQLEEQLAALGIKNIRILEVKVGKCKLKT